MGSHTRPSRRVDRYESAGVRYIFDTVTPEQECFLNNFQLPGQSH